MNFVLTILLKATLILVLSSILLLVFRKSSASLRHWIISLTLIGLIALPFCTEYLPTWEVEIPISAESSSAKEIPSNAMPTDFTPQSTLEAATTFSPMLPTSSTEPTEEAILPVASSSWDWPMISFTIWLIGSIFLLAHLLLGLYKMHRITKNSQAFELPFASQINPKTRILISPSIETPMTWGVQCPVILLPKFAAQWDTKTLETVITHELAHIKRGDYWIQILSWVSISIYWFHPLVWWMKNRQALEREKACDEYVMQSGLPNQDYAKQLVQVARHLSSHPTVRAPYALPMAKHSQIKQRILAILNFQKERFRFNRIKQVQWAGCYVGSIVLLAAFTPVEPVAIMERIDPDHELTAYLKDEIAQAKLSPAPSIEKVETIAISSNDTINKHAVLIPKSKNPAISIPNIVAKPVALFRSKPQELPAVEINKPSNIVASTPQPTVFQSEGLHGTWKSGKSTFEVWTQGNIDFSEDIPYLEARTANSIIIIEEKRKTLRGTKTFRMLITRTPYNGGLVIEFADEEPKSWNGSFRKNDPLYLFYINDEFKFFGKHKLKWLADKLPEIKSRLMFAAYDKEGKWEKIDSNHPMIQKYAKEKANRFRTYEDLPENDFESDPYWKMLKHRENPPFDFSSVPLAEPIASVNPNGNLKKIGRTKATKTHSGGNVFDVGQKFGTVIKNVPKGTLLHDLNFFLRINDFENITFALSLYSVDAQGIKSRITKSPIRFETDTKGWITVDLQTYQLIAEGNILVILELADLKGRINQDHIFFALGKGKSYSFHEQTGKEWGFWEGNFAFYFNGRY